LGIVVFIILLIGGASAYQMYRQERISYVPNTSYKELVEQYFYSLDLNFNAALEAYDQENIGEAVFYARKALILSSSHRKSRELLSHLEADIPGASLGIPFTIPGDLLFWLLILTVNISAVMVGLLLRNRRLKEAFALILMISVILSGFYLYANIQGGITRAVAKNSIELFKIPQDQGSKWASLPAGTSFFVLGSQNGFYLIETEYQKKGWVKSEEASLYSGQSRYSGQSGSTGGDYE
jgi:hypothetical protein